MVVGHDHVSQCFKPRHHPMSSVQFRSESTVTRVPKPQNVIFFETPDKLRQWLEANHETAVELWVGCHRKSTGRPTVTGPAAIDQARCFGWIAEVPYSL